jgi:Lipocalin-like domain
MNRFRFAQLVTCGLGGRGFRGRGLAAVLAASVVLSAPPLGAGAAVAEPANATHARMIGTWTLVSLTGGDGANLAEPFGKVPKGVMTVDPNGRFSIIIRRADLPKIGSNNRLTATPEEGQAIVKSSIAYFGTLTFQEGAEVTAHIEASTFANADGENQRRVVTFRGDEMEYANFSSSFGAAVAKAVWKRAN